MRRDFKVLAMATLLAVLGWLTHSTVWVQAEDARPTLAAHPVPGSPTPVAPSTMAPPPDGPGAAPKASPAADATPEKPEYVGSEACMGCHEDYGKRFQLTLHSKVPAKSQDAANQCESCHGPGSVHVNAGGGPAGIVNPSRLQGHTASAVCTKCHESQPHVMEWRFSKHASNGVSCNQCHSVHPPKKELEANLLRRGGDPALCYTCHAEVRAETQWPSHHPIPEGRMVCSDCHNVHGAELTAFKDAPTERELCLQCHAQYRGPFAAEHQPNSESCSNCHRPHGAYEDNLLQASEPFLCMRCHSTVHNPHLPAGVLPDSTVRNEVLFFSRCSTCHQEVHGSQFPDKFTR